ncbi:MAG: SufD family Fe-S cluster assembly protein [Lachnospiraceae bacterium]|nr:SufD family Fe-S cluster assembly protein [Lachnospiraceae bacterium]
MENNVNMKINPLPALTWNRLKMNEGAVEVIKAQTGADIVMSKLPTGVSLTKLPRTESNGQDAQRESRIEQDCGCEDGLPGNVRAKSNPQQIETGMDTSPINGHQMEPGADIGFAAWQQVESGMGADFDRYMADSSLALLETAADSHIEKPIIITLEYQENMAAADRIYLHVVPKSSLSVIFVLKSAQKVQASLQIKTIAEPEAQVELYVIQLTGGDSTVLTDVSSLCEEKASVSLTKLELGGGIQYAGVCTTLKGNKSQFYAEAGYRVRGEQHLDMNYLVRHVGRKTTSEMNASGVLEEGAFKLFRGTIDFPRGCAGAKGNEKEDILLLGERQVNQTIPLILCKEEDVEGNHGATIGRLPEQVLFYLGTRGISADAAEDLIASAKLEAVCARIPDEKVKQTVRAFLCAMSRERLCG